MIVELHIIQNFAPSNLNRDDSNTPKDCEFGGYRRARISSQCIKRSVRWHQAFQKTVREAGGDFGLRTKRVIGKVADLLVEKHGKNQDESLVIAEKIVTLLGVKRDDKKPDKTSILLFLGENELSDIAAIATKYWESISAKEIGKETETALKKELKSLVGDERIKSGSYAADIALFGRMVADKNVKNMSVDAACQVAHAISTHKVEMQLDYFTAVDDLLKDEESGSDMIGVVEFNSSCFYRYSAIDLNKLNENLGFNSDLLSATVKGYIDASVKAVPTGKQNSMAAQNPPGYVRVLVRKDGFPWSLANAFQKPVYASRENGSLEEASITELEKYLTRLKSAYGDSSIVCDAQFSLYAEKTGSLELLLEAVGASLNKGATA
jgi:CRISPR system Cascade subunit CasC